MVRSAGRRTPGACKATPSAGRYDRHSRLRAPHRGGALADGTLRPAHRAVRSPSPGLRSHLATARGRGPDGDGFTGQRRVLQGGLRRQDLAGIVLDLRGHRAARGGACGPDQRIFPGILGRVDRDARRGQSTDFPFPDPRSRHSGNSRRRHGIRHDRHRHRLHPGVREDKARPGSHRQGP
jgi:hypothetical protein